jgi:hypothetical protein
MLGVLSVTKYSQIIIHPTNNPIYFSVSKLIEYIK